MRRNGRRLGGGVLAGLLVFLSLSVVAAPPALAAGDLVIFKNDTRTVVLPGQPLTYRIDVLNIGPDTATDAVVNDTFPVDFINVTWTCTGNCSTASGSGNINVQVTLQSGDMATIFASGTVSPDAGTQLSNTATVTPPGGFTDSNLSNNSSTDTDRVVRFAELDITKDNGTTEVTQGGAVTYTITVTNFGPHGVTGALVNDDVPAQLTGVQWTCVGTSGGTCPASGSGDLTNVPVSLPPNGVATFTVTGTLSPSATGTLTNTATVTPAAGYEDEPENNTATDTDTIATLTCSPGLDFRTATSGQSIRGTQGDDVICGSPFADSIQGLGGNDTIFGFGGNDLIQGGDGNDTMAGGEGDDTLSGPPGVDSADGGPGYDRCTARTNTNCEVARVV